MVTSTPEKQDRKDLREIELGIGDVLLCNWARFYVYYKLSLLNSEKHEEFKKVLRSGTLITYLRGLPVDSRD